jgi:peptidyl-prolyl cis-trans isomerase C
MAQAAAKAGLDKSAEVVSQLDNLRQQLLVRAYIQEHFRKNPVGDGEVKAEYDRIRKELGDKEFKARHILVKGEDDAKGIIAKLKSGAKFDELAKQSEDPGSKDRGGDLDWARPANYVPEFARALSALKKGETTDTPVKTQFGFHVIRLDDIRDAKLPSIDEARPQLTDRVQRQKLDRLLADLRKGVKIE